MTPRLQTAARIVRSLRYYRAEQLLFKVWFTLRSRFPRIPGPKVTRVPMQLSWEPILHAVPFPSNPYTVIASIEEGRFTFLNETKDLGEDIQWCPKNAGRLWIYNLHYFDYLQNLIEVNLEGAWQLLERWIAHNPPGTSDAWDSYPLSLRIVNWIQAFSSSPIGLEVQPVVMRSLYQQCLWLERWLEWHLLANHLFKNAKALVFAGLFFSGGDAHRWLKSGLKILHEQLEEQVLSDGGHFERSPMYHAMILKDCLDLFNGLKRPREGFDKEILASCIGLKEHLRRIVPEMGFFLAGMTHPDGKIALFNDAAHGIEPDFEHLEAYSQRVTGNALPKIPIGTTAFPDSGYFIMAKGSEDRLIVDAGPIGPDYQPGHSHCDTLSFELSLRGIRVVVDSGCYEYEDTPIRQYNRGNPGHNTVTVDGENQSEVWGSHRCARRAKPIYARMRSNGNKVLCFEGAHDGYRRLSGSPVHHRRVEWYPERIQIEDRVEGSGYHGIESRLHFNPSLDVDFDGKTATVTANGQRLLSVSWLGEGCMEKIYGWYCPEFGMKFKCVVLCVTHRCDLPFRGSWILSLHSH